MRFNIFSGVTYRTGSLEDEIGIIPAYVIKAGCALRAAWEITVRQVSSRTASLRLAFHRSQAPQGYEVVGFHEGDGGLVVKPKDDHPYSI